MMPVIVVPAAMLAAIIVAVMDLAVEHDIDMPRAAEGLHIAPACAFETGDAIDRLHRAVDHRPLAVGAALPPWPHPHRRAPGHLVGDDIGRRGLIDDGRRPRRL